LPSGSRLFAAGLLTAAPQDDALAEPRPVLQMVMLAAEAREEIKQKEARRTSVLIIIRIRPATKITHGFAPAVMGELRLR